MKKNFLFLILLLCSTLTFYGQVSVNTDNSDPDPAAMLDVKSTDKGVLIPRVALVSATDPISIIKPEGLLVWNTSTTGNYPEPGFYYWDGSDWVQIAAGSGTAASYEIVDSDNDTRISVEYTTDEDTIRFFVAGNEVMKHDGKTLHMTDPYNNVFIGNKSGEANIDGEFNIALGGEALKDNTTGDSNIAIGGEALEQNGAGNGNIAVGNRALFKNDNGFGNTALGSQAGYQNISGDNNVFLGKFAGYNETGNHKLYIENSQALPEDALIYGDFDAEILAFDASVGIGTITPTAELEVNGTVVADDFIGDVHAIDISDSDEDTRITVEDSPDEDTIRFYVSGTEVMKLDGMTLHFTEPRGNVLIGENSGSSITTSYATDNIAIGRDALKNNTFVGGLVAIGSSALFNAGATIFPGLEPEKNTAIGYMALYSTNYGKGNTATGFESGFSNTYGDYNSFYGAWSGYSHSTGWGNTFIGSESGRFNSTGTGNSFFGELSGYNNPGDSNIFIGFMAGLDELGSNKLYIENSEAGPSDALIYGEFDNDMLAINGHVGIGTTMPSTELEVNGTVTATSFVGDGSGLTGVAGDSDWTIAGNYVYNLNDSIGIGTSTPGASLEVAGHIWQTGLGGSIYIGEDAGVNDDLSNRYNIGIGYESLYWTSTGTGNLAFGSGSLKQNTTGEYNIAIGIEASLFNASGDNNVCLGYFTNSDNLNGNNNTMLGSMAGGGLIGPHSKSGNVFLGFKAGYNEGGDNKLYIENSEANSDNALIYGEFDNDLLTLNAMVGIGTTTPGASLEVVGHIWQTGTGQSVFLGEGAGVNDDGTNNYNSFIGFQSGNLNTSGFNNSFYGSFCGSSNTTGSSNSFFGSSSGQNNTTGAMNSFFGSSSGSNNILGTHNAFYGGESGRLNIIGSSNSFFGAFSGWKNTAGNKNIFLGYAAGYYETGSNKLYIENSDANSANALIYGEFDNDILTFNAKVGIGTSPSELLHIYENHSSNYTATRLENGAASGQGGAQYEIKTDGNQFNLGVGGSANSSLGSKFYIYQQSAGARMVIDGSGQVGIGATNPASKLSNDATLCSDGTKSTNTDGINWRINGGGYALGIENAATGGSGLLVEAGNNSGTGSTVAHFVSNNASLMYIREDGNIGINTTSPSFDLHCNGSAGKPGGGSWSTASDERLKAVHGNFTRGLEEIQQINPVSYNYKQNNELDLPTEQEYVGVIAQEVQNIIPEAVEEMASGHLAVNNDPIIWTMLNAIKEQQKTIDELKDRIEELEKK